MNGGILLIDKEENVTSRFVDNKIGKIFSTKKVGHLGTLDPFATGLLVVAVNEGTKFLQLIEDSDKTYIAKLKLGYSSSTGDLTGDIKKESFNEVSENHVIDALNSFLGESYQIPPMTSAIKVNGEALYKKAHKGEVVEREKRLIKVKSIKLLSFDKDIVEFECEVSKGTYIRVLGEDIAKKLGTAGYLLALRRTKINQITLENSIKIEDVDNSKFVNPVSLLNLPKIKLEGSMVKKVENGMTIDLESKESKVLLLDGDKALAVYELRDDNYYHCLRGLNGNN